SASMAAARRLRFWPASVSASRREVRLNRRGASRSSTRGTALGKGAFGRLSSAAAPGEEGRSATLAEIARPSRSGQLDMGDSRNNGQQPFRFLRGRSIAQRGQCFVVRSAKRKRACSRYREAANTEECMTTSSGHTTAILASKVKGTAVYNDAGERIGTV